MFESTAHLFSVTQLTGFIRCVKACRVQAENHWAPLLPWALCQGNLHFRCSLAPPLWPRPRPISPLPLLSLGVTHPSGVFLGSWGRGPGGTSDSARPWAAAPESSPLRSPGPTGAHLANGCGYLWRAVEGRGGFSTLNGGSSVEWGSQSCASPLPRDPNIFEGTSNRAF